MLASHGDGTFTVKYSDGQTEEDVPKACVRAVAGSAGERGRSNRSRSASRGRREGRARADSRDEGVWVAVERMARELAKRAGAERKKISSWRLEAEKDEVRCLGAPPPPRTLQPQCTVHTTQPKQFGLILVGFGLRSRNDI